MHHSTGVACAILLLIFGCWSESDARPIERPAKLAVAAPDTEQSIHTALTESSPTRAEVLLDRGANIEARNARGATPLIAASGRGNLALITLLLKQGAQIEARDRDGNTALHEASFQSHVDCVEALLAAGAPTTIRNGLGFTPLHQAVRRFWETAGESRADRLARQAEVIDRLLQAGADPEIQDSGGRTPVGLAIESSNAGLRLAFSPPPAHATATTVVPTVPQSGKERTEDSSQSLVVPPAEITSGATSGASNGPVLTPPIDQPQETLSPSHPPNGSAKAGAQSTTPLPALPPTPPPTAPHDSTAPALPATGDSPLEPSAPTVPAPAQPTLLGSASIETHSMTTPAPSAAMPPPQRHSDSHAPAPQPSIPQASEKLAASTPEQEQSPGAKPLSFDQPVTTETAPPTAPTPQAAIVNPPREIAPVPPPPDHRHIVPGRNHPEAFPPIVLAQTAPSAESGPARPSLASPPSAPSTESNDSSAVRPSRPTQPASHSSHLDDAPAEDRPGSWIVQNVGFGLGLGWTHNLGQPRVESVTVVNRIVRIDDERNDLVRVMPEVHLWIDRWDEQRWSWGPFLTVAPGSRVIDAVGGGLMMGYRPHRSDHYSFNFGIGGLLDLDARVLGNGIVANEPLPARETGARTKQTTAAGLLILFSVGWDLSAPRQAPQTDHQ